MEERSVKQLKNVNTLALRNTVLMQNSRTCAQKSERYDVCIVGSHTLLSLIDQKVQTISAACSLFAIMACRKLSPAVCLH